MIYIKIFLMFAKLSIFAFGGGYVMFPMLIEEVEKNKLLSIADLTNIIAIAGMSPGAVAVNAAVGTGYKVAGFGGAVSAFMGIATPCAIIVIAVATFFFKIYENKFLQAALYGLRPVITGIIIYAAIKIGMSNGILFPKDSSTISNGWYAIIGSLKLFEVRSIIIAVAAFLVLVKTKIHPVLVILASAVVGMAVYR